MCEEAGEIQLTEHEQDLQRIRGFRLIDDDFMNACFDGNIEGTELLLRIILNEPDLTVSRVETQKLLKNLAGRDIWLDIDATSCGKEYNVEIQRADKGAEPERARVHSSYLDSHALKPREDYSAIPNSYVIFITENDVLGGGLPIYHVRDTIEQMNDKEFPDRRHIIYVNGADQNASTDLGKLMHDFFCTKAVDMNFKVLADRVRYFKESDEGVKHMCKVLEDMREETAREQETKTLADTARNLMETMKWSFDQTMENMKVPQGQRNAVAGILHGDCTR